MERRFPDVKTSIEDTAVQMMNAVKNARSDGESAEYIRSQENVIQVGLTGLLNAIEWLSQGKTVSREFGPTPINVMGAFVFWLSQNPEVEENFRNSDMFNELCDSGHDGYAWSDPENNGGTPIAQLFNFSEPEENVSEPDVPGNYL
jgi:hypothetical protein